MTPLLGRGRKEQEIEKILSEVREKNDFLERRLEETVEKIERVERGTRLLTEAVYKIITYLKDLEWTQEEVKQRIEERPLPVIRKKEPAAEEYLTEIEAKLLEEIKKRGILTVSECYAHVGRSKEHVSRLLKRLVEKGILIRERKGKTFYYRLAEK
jgi:DNA-binding MarR family transcriptional regulator